MKRFYAHGKLMLCGEYLVLDGAEALALPTKKGQSLECTNIQEAELIWKSFDPYFHQWLEVHFELPSLRLKHATYDTVDENSDADYAERLQEILLEAKALNPDFLNKAKGFMIETYLEFERDWGLGSSSTLLSCLAQWAKIDAFELSERTFKGSGYDIACAQAKGPIVYQRLGGSSITKSVSFDPVFSEELFFVHLNQKMNSREGIKNYRALEGGQREIQIEKINTLTQSLISADSLESFSEIIDTQEALMSDVLQVPTIKKQLFADFSGSIKSLGAWGGDFVLATGGAREKKYFEDKGYKTIVNYKDMIL